MSLTFYYLFIFLLITTTLFQVWLTKRHIAHIQKNKNTVPIAFSKTISILDHKKAADYTIAKSHVGVIDLFIQAIFLYLLTLGGGINTITDIFSNSLNNELLIGSMVIISVMLISSLVDLPLSLYKTFNIDERFGFNRMTAQIFIIDLIKQSILSLLIGIPILLISLWIISNLGNFWWLWLWLFISIFNFSMLTIYPTYIAPFFNKFLPLKDKKLKAKIEKLLSKCGFKSGGLFVMNGSLRSNHGNAYFTGFGNSKRIVFFDTLLEKLSHKEIEAVLAHELGHFHHNHVKKRIILMFVISFIGLYILGILKDSSWFYLSLGVTQSDANGLLLFLLVSPLFIFFIKPLMAYYSRKNEFEADEYACKHASPQDLKISLIKLYRDNASTLTPDPLHSNFYDSHPPALERINTIDKI
ncbi:M48 family metallopeptidase [Methylophilaceae bacterium]|nr:M48 family metallopeptidase [Methylophilaceae bacterium]|tara:strand:- start:2130 stop:3368 length:1239 start_codon:yes stop_codon:yes gene_type:complete